MDLRKDNGKKRDRIGVVLYLAYLVMLLASVLVIGKIAGIQLFWRQNDSIVKVLTPPVTRNVIDPARGNIIDSEGRLLAMTCPIYQFYMDCTVRKGQPEKDELEWLSQARALSAELAKVFPEKTADQYYKLIRDSRAAGKKYVKIGRPVDRNLYNRIIRFPLFEKQRYYSGMIVEREYIRKYPYGTLARRTIGFVRNNKSSEVTNNHVGIEGKFDHELHGKNGIEYFRKTDQGRIRDNDSLYVKAEDGNDLRITINIDYQEIADRALREQIEGRVDIMGATVCLMEVSTGAIRAMVNLTHNEKTGAFEETQNMVVGRKIEPGSVFKTVTLMSVLNDGYVKSLEETFPATNGHVSGTDINDQHIPDFARQHNTDKISMLDGFKISSNYVFAKLAIDNYAKKQRQFIDNIYSYKLGEAFDFDLDGLPVPTVPNKKENGMKLNDLGRLGFGYMSEETPLHILTYYNAIANKGKMMKPYLVEDIEKGGVVLKKRGPAVLNAAICSRAVADTLNRALLAVAEEGTAKWSLMGVKCSVAGKTGTSFGTFPGGGYSDANGQRKYQSTFVGYFPAEDPQYTIISTLYSYPKPHSSEVQGGGIPAKTVKSVINALYNIDPYFQPVLAKSK
ncbi:MAG: hypothetical protein K6F25_02150 [Bacteroidales bacterium]|nr:hypothetical protein [Bacteroidales bacterium]